MFLLVPAYPGSPGQKAVKRLCACVCVYVLSIRLSVCLFICLSAFRFRHINERDDTN